jgi:hypothetical protein
MKQHQAILFCIVALVMRYSAKADSDFCLPSTCPPGPVVLEFEHKNCTGDVVYRSMNLQIGVCDNGKLTESTEHGLYIWTSENSPACDYTASQVTFSYEANKYGACSPIGAKRDYVVGTLLKRQEFSSMALAVMILANVNDSYSVPSQTFDNQPLPAWQDSTEPCSSLDNCTRQDGAPSQSWFNLYAELGCQQPTSQFNPFEEMNVCKNYYNFTYAMATCLNEHATSLTFYLDDACTQPIYSTGSQKVCSQTTSQTTHCTATPTPIPSFAPPASPEPYGDASPEPSGAASPEPSGASSQYLAVLAIVIALISVISLL